LNKKRKKEIEKYLDSLDEPGVHYTHSEILEGIKLILRILKEEL